MQTMDIERLRADAASVAKVAENLAEQLRVLGNIVNSTKEYWNDPVQQEFAQRYEEYKVSLNEQITYLNGDGGLSKRMNQYASKEEEKIQTGKKMFGF